MFRRGDDAESVGAIGQVIGRVPAPEFACMMLENCRDLLDRLDDDILKTIALCKMEGDSNLEIARKLDYTVRSIERKLAQIRDKWTFEDDAR